MWVTNEGAEGMSSPTIGSALKREQENISLITLSYNHCIKPTASSCGCSSQLYGKDFFKLLLFFTAVCVCALSLSHVWLFMTPWTCRPPCFSVHGILFGKITGVGWHFLLQGDLPDPVMNLCLLHWQEDSSPLCHWSSIIP